MQRTRVRYSREARYCVVLVSRDYDRREWSRLERETIQSRELLGERDVLLPVKLEAYSPEWLPASRFYFDLASRSTEELGALVKNKLEGASILERRSRAKYEELVSNIREYSPGEYEAQESKASRITSRQYRFVWDLLLGVYDQTGILQRNHIDGSDLELLTELGVIRGSAPGSIHVDQAFGNFVVERSVQ